MSEVNSRELPTRVLIATRGNEFKGAVVGGLVEHLRAQGDDVGMNEGVLPPG